MKTGSWCGSRQCCRVPTAQLGINQRGKRNNNKSFISIITDNDRDEIKEKTTNRNLYIFLQLCCFNWLLFFCCSGEDDLSSGYPSPKFGRVYVVKPNLKQPNKILNCKYLFVFCMYSVYICTYMEQLTDPVRSWSFDGCLRNTKNSAMFNWQNYQNNYIFCYICYIYYHLFLTVHWVGKRKKQQQ